MGRIDSAIDHGTFQQEDVPRGRLHRLLDRFDRPFRFAGRLTLVSLVIGALGTVVGSFFQYTAWREEQNLARYKEDFAKATETFVEVSAELASAMNLQQLIYFNHKQAVNENVDNKKDSLQYRNANKVCEEYFTARTGLRRHVDLLARKMEMFIDRPSVPEPTVSPLRIVLQDPIVPAPVATNLDALQQSGFDCAAHLPKFGVRDIAGIDWFSSKHHVVTFYHCLEKIHSRIYISRAWASGAAVDDDDRKKFKEEDRQTRTESMLNDQITRLNAFMVLAMRRIEDIRQKNRPRGFVCHYTLYWCGSTGQVPVVPAARRES
jgi:hypothetical protein